MGPDFRILLARARKIAQSYWKIYGEYPTTKVLVQEIATVMQDATQSGGVRPFGVSLLYAGFDAHHGFQLYQSDPSGNYSGWKATCIGMNNGTATSLLKQEYKDDMDVKQALGLAARVLSKTMDTTSMESDKLEFAVLKRHERTQEPQPYILESSDIDRVLQLHNLAKVPEDASSMAVDA